VWKFKEHSACGMMVGLWGIEFLALLLISGAALVHCELPERCFYEGEVAVIEL
jgi:hypothetical protein